MLFMNNDNAKIGRTLHLLQYNFRVILSLYTYSKQIRLINFCFLVCKVVVVEREWHDNTFVLRIANVRDFHEDIISRIKFCCSLKYLGLSIFVNLALYTCPLIPGSCSIAFYLTIPNLNILTNANLFYFMP